MASPEIDYPWSSSAAESFGGCFDIQIVGTEGEDSGGTLDFLEDPRSPAYDARNIPKPPPPPPPGKVYSRSNTHRGRGESDHVPKEIRDTWDKLFNEGYGADVHIITEGGSFIPAHYTLLCVASPVLGNVLQQSKVKNGIRCIKIPGVPHDAVSIFIRFLYSACYEEGDMRKFVLHLLVLSHSYSVPSLKRVCIHLLEQCCLTPENVIDVLQLARNFDAPRLIVVCIRMIVRDFKTVSLTEGWRVMRHSNPMLEQELLESVVEADSRKQDRLKKIEERKVYLQLHEAVEALIHISRDGCRTIGPQNKILKTNQGSCSFPACKGLETLVRHFSICKVRVPGGCVHCKRMWQLLELHSRMCDEPDQCKVPLCRHLKEKMLQQTKKEETKWNVLVSKVRTAKNSMGPFPSARSTFL